MKPQQPDYPEPLAIYFEGLLKPSVICPVQTTVLIPADGCSGR